MQPAHTFQVEQWVDAVLQGDAGKAHELAEQLERAGFRLRLTRNLYDARRYARARTAVATRSGLIASDHGKRLVTEGVFVAHQTDITTWMTASSNDPQSSVALELVQDQRQMEGRELDCTIVCWDADLRRDADEWTAFRVVGADWQRDRRVLAAKERYRVLLTRARNDMLIFVPTGDLSGEDPTRAVAFYDDVSTFLARCGAKLLR